MPTPTIDRWVDALGLTVEWSDDWTVQDHVAEYDCYDVPPTTCEFAMVRNKQGDVIDSLGCIDDATDEYRKEIERELLETALHTLLKEAAHVHHR